jgi:single-strand DNA-binding protein
MNTIVLSGNVGKEVSSSFTPKGILVCKTSLAVKVGKDITNWYQLTVWGKDAEAFKDVVGAGERLIVVGKIEMKKWTDKNGVERTTPEVTVISWEKVSGKNTKPKKEDDEELPY